MSYEKETRQTQGWTDQTERIKENLEGMSMEDALREHLFGLDDPFEDRDPFEFL